MRRAARAVAWARVQTAVLNLRKCAAIAVALGLFAFPALADDGVSIELQAASDVEGACHATFAVRNGLQHTLDRFRIDFYVFGAEGAAKSRSNVDLAPLPQNRRILFSFRISTEPCTVISKVLVNDIPQCRAAHGGTLDCLSQLAVSSRGSIELVRR